jgi:hypothetical protein
MTSKMISGKSRLAKISILLILPLFFAVGANKLENSILNKSFYKEVRQPSVQSFAKSFNKGLEELQEKRDGGQSLNKDLAEEVLSTAELRANWTKKYKLLILSDKYYIFTILVFFGSFFAGRIILKRFNKKEADYSAST